MCLISVAWVSHFREKKVSSLDNTLIILSLWQTTIAIESLGITGSITAAILTAYTAYCFFHRLRNPNSIHWKSIFILGLFGRVSGLFGRMYNGYVEQSGGTLTNAMLKKSRCLHYRRNSNGQLKLAIQEGILLIFSTVVY